MYEEEEASRLLFSDSGFQEEDRIDFSYPWYPDYDEDDVLTELGEIMMTNSRQKQCCYAVFQCYFRFCF